MAKNFQIVKGVHPVTGNPVELALTTKEIDELDEFFGAAPTSELVYKGQREVTGTFCPRGVLPNDKNFVTSFCDNPTPRVNYRDVKTGMGAQVSASEWVEWLGKEWQAEQVKESKETKEHNEKMVKRGMAILESQKPENKFNLGKVEEEAKKDKDKPSFKQIIRKKSRRSSKK